MLSGSIHSPTDAPVTESAPISWESMIASATKFNPEESVPDDTLSSILGVTEEFVKERWVELEEAEKNKELEMYYDVHNAE